MRSETSMQQSPDRLRILPSPLHGLVGNMALVVKHAACAPYRWDQTRSFTLLKTTITGSVAMRLGGNANVLGNVDQTGIMAGTSAAMTSHTCALWIIAMAIPRATVFTMAISEGFASSANVQSRGAQTQCHSKWLHID